MEEFKEVCRFSVADFFWADSNIDTGLIQDVEASINEFCLYLEYVLARNLILSLISDDKLYYKYLELIIGYELDLLNDDQKYIYSECNKVLLLNYSHIKVSPFVNLYILNDAQFDSIINKGHSFHLWTLYNRCLDLEMAFSKWEITRDILPYLVYNNSTINAPILELTNIQKLNLQSIKNNFIQASKYKTIDMRLLISDIRNLPREATTTKFISNVFTFKLIFDYIVNGPNSSMKMLCLKRYDNLLFEIDRWCCL